ncbi:hypothetical protein GCM10027600_36850 [Nocardioides ginsengisegetis]
MTWAAAVLVAKNACALWNVTVVGAPSLSHVTGMETAAEDNGRGPKLILTPSGKTSGWVHIRHPTRPPIIKMLTTAAVTPARISRRRGAETLGVARVGL